MIFKSIPILKSEGFQGFYSISQLTQNSSLIPSEKGIYLFLYNEPSSPIFINPGSGGFFKGKNPNVSIEELKANWVENTTVVYIGKSGTSTGNATLNSRLIQYLKFGQGKNIGHYGGRYIWQIKTHKDLIICWKTTPNQDPRALEKEMIKDFVIQYGNRPFANLVG